MPSLQQTLTRVLIVEPKNSCNHVLGFQAELRVAKQEPDGPRERLVQRLSHRHHIPRPQYIGTDRAHPEGPLITPALSTVTSEKSQGASGRVLGVAAYPQGKLVDNPWTVGQKEVLLVLPILNTSQIGYI